LKCLQTVCISKKFFQEYVINWDIYESLFTYSYHTSKKSERAEELNLPEIILLDLILIHLFLNVPSVRAPWQSCCDILPSHIIASQILKISLP